MNTGERIKNTREDMDILQQELANTIGINVSVLSRIENGTRPVRDDELIKIADCFNVSTDYLMGRTKYTDKDSNPPSGQPSARELSPEEESLLHAYRNATDRDKSIVDAVLHPKV